MKKCVIAGMLIMLSASLVLGQVDSQWRGPNRDGVYPNETLLKKWPADGPKLIWETDIVGDGFSSPAVTKDRVYVTGMVKGTGYLFAFSHKGKRVWKAAYGPDWTGDYPGSRTTPTVVGNSIYLLSGMGRVVCLNTLGKIVWSVEMNLFGATSLRWGKTESLLVDGDRVFFTAGSQNVLMAALDRNTGATIWKIKGNGDQSSYASPWIVNHNGRRILLTMTAKSVVGIDADVGKFLWSKPHITEYDVNANTPLYKDGFIYTVSGYGTGGKMFKLSKDGSSIKQVWKQKTLDSQIGSTVLVDGYIYGSGHNKRAWHCLDWKTGAVQFSKKAIGNKGNIILSDGMMYCYSERGDVGLVRPNPKKFDVVSSFKMTKGSGQHWAHPVIKKGRLYIRHGNVLMVFNIAR
jgi:outer membrane protein assembly factor BamB